MQKKIIYILLLFIVIVFVQTIEGQLFSPIKRLTWHSIGSDYRAEMVIDTSGGLHLFWEYLTSTDHELMYKRSTDSGLHWSSRKRLTWMSGTSSFMSIKTKKDTNDLLFLVWQDNPTGQYEIYLKASLNNGVTWSAPFRLTWNQINSELPDVAIDSNNHIHVVWTEGIPNDTEIYHKKGSGLGGGWTAKNRLTWNSGLSSYPKLIVDTNDTLYLVYADKSPGNFEIFFKKSTDFGVTWMARKRITWNSGSSNFPEIVLDGNGHLHLVWNDNTPGYAEIYYCKSTNEGSIWSARKRLTWNSGISMYPDIAEGSGGMVYIVWMDDSPGDFQIYYKQSTDSGSSWGISKRLTWTSSWSATPTVASNSTVYIAWTDNKIGNFHVYYKYKITMLPVDLR